MIKAVCANYTDLKPIVPNAADPKLGGGKMCTLTEPITINQAINNIKKFSGLGYVHVGLAVGTTLNSPIKTVAVCAGSGSSVLRNTKADLYITGEMSHHEVLDATHNGSTCFLLNHSNSERYFLGCFKSILLKEFPDLPVFVSEKDEDPLTTV